MADVVRLRGDGPPIRHPGNPDPDVVATLEELLEMARAGEINGIAFAVHYFDDAANDRYVGECSSKTVGRLFGLMSRIARQIDNS